MLIKAKDVVGLQVITKNEGKKIENIDDIVYDPQSNKVLALIANNGGMFSTSKVIMYTDILKIGPDAVMVESAEALQESSKVE